MSPSSNDPEITVTAEVGEQHALSLEQRLREAWALVEGAPPVLSVAIIDETTMAELHERFLGVAGPTDVLTFEIGHDASGLVTEGEILICLEVAEAQAKARGHPVEHELLLYALHGLLHLSGYDDQSDSDYARMHAREDEVLTRLGLGAVFSRGGGT